MSDGEQKECVAFPDLRGLRLASSAGGWTLERLAVNACGGRWVAVESYPDMAQATAGAYLYAGNDQIGRALGLWK